jgi:AcrR family transcriptional regulator
MEWVKSRRASYAALTRAAVLEAARDAFVEHGFAATSIDDIARAAGVSKGAVYHHFASKEDLFAELFRRSQEAALDEATAQGAHIEPLWAQVHAIAGAFLSTYLSDPAARSLLRQSSSVLGLERCRRIDGELALPLITEVLRDLRARGELAPVPPEVTAQVILSVLCEAVSSIVAAPDPERALSEVRQVLHALLSGLRASPGNEDRPWTGGPTTAT